MTENTKVTFTARLQALLASVLAYIDGWISTISFGTSWLDTLIQKIVWFMVVTILMTAVLAGFIASVGYLWEFIPQILMLLGSFVQLLLGWALDGLRELVGQKPVADVGMIIPHEMVAEAGRSLTRF